MKIKTSELTGAALDWAVAKVEGLQIAKSPEVFANTCARPFYSTDWAQGGAIIDANPTMQFWLWGGKPRDEMQCSTLPIKEKFGTRMTTYFGKTKLIAGMRAYVASRLGDEVEIPEELCNSQ